jgi:hypothetical protein
MWKKSYWSRTLSSPISAIRLDHRDHSFPAETAGGMAQVLYESAVRERAVGAGRDDAGEAMDPPAAGGRGVLDRELEVCAEAVLSPRQAGRAVLVSSCVAARHVVQHHLHACGAGPRRDFRGSELIWVLVLDRAEAGLCGGRETVEEGPFLEEGRQVGGEPRHGREDNARLQRNAAVLDFPSLNPPPRKG